AEDGIRDRTVTGVQTCALPILLLMQVVWRALALARERTGKSSAARIAIIAITTINSIKVKASLPGMRDGRALQARNTGPAGAPQIGRASCRERVEISEGAVGGK